MFRRLTILLLIVSGFAQNDKLILINGETHNIKYIETLSDGTVRVQIFKNDSMC